MRRTAFLGAGLFGVLGLGALLLGARPPEAGRALGALLRRSEPAPVLVLVVDGPQALAAVRAAIADERIRVERAGAFALREERVVAGSPEAVGPLLADAGWVDRRVELLAPRSFAVREPRRPARAGGEEGGEEITDLTALARKPTLSPGEALALLRHLER